MGARTASWPRVLQLLPPALGATGMLVLALQRGESMDRQRGAFVDCQGCFVGMAVNGDLWMIAAALALCAIVGTVCSAPKALSKATRIVAFAAVTLMCLIVAVDTGLGATLGHRLLLADVLNYGGEGGAFVDIAMPYVRSTDGMLTALGFLLAVAGFGASLIGRWRLRSGLAMAMVAATATLALGGALRTPPHAYFDEAFVGNVIAIQGLDSGLRHHSSTMAHRIRKLPAPVPSCSAFTAGARPSNVIVVVLESWSLHHSQLFSGLADATPKLDAWARRGRWFPDFIANSYSTETGLIALLNGYVPIPSHRSWGAIAFREVDGDFHRWLSSRGWHTRFATTGALHFGERDAFLRQIGIAEAEGSEQSFYAGMPRGAFQAANDRVLVERFLQWHDHERRPVPTMSTLLTVGTHPPFIDVDPNDPDEPGEPASLRRMDEAIDRLLRELEARGVLENGTVFVVGDHRAMTPVGRDEALLFGESSLSRVPAFVLGVGAENGGAATGPFQQADLLPSLRALIGGTDCRTPWQGRFLGPAPTPAEVVVYAHPRWRNELRVVLPTGTYRLRLDGDQTGWVGEVPPNGESILNEAMRQRLSRDPPED